MIDRGNQQQPTGHVGELAHSRSERLLQPFGQRQPLGQHPSDELVRTQRDRELQQGEEVACRLGEQPFAHPWGKRGSVGSQQRGRRRLLQSLQAQLEQPGLAQGAPMTFPDGGQQDNRLRLQPPGNERQHIT
jgi:hypothetical protein